MLNLPPKAARLYRACSITVITVFLLWLIAGIAVTLLSAFDNGLLASPWWGPLFMLLTLPAVLLLLGVFLLLRRLLILKLSDLPQIQKQREAAFAICLFILTLLCALCCVLWFAGLFYLMYVAAACPLIICILLIVHRMQKKK